MTAMQVLGWALVHSLWQEALVAVGLAALLAILPARAARIRYALAVMTLALMVALPIWTALRLHHPAPQAATSAWMTDFFARTPARALLPTAAVEPGRLEVGQADVTLGAARWRAAFEPALPWVVALWLGGVLLLSLRLASGWRTAQRLVTVGTRPAPPRCVEALGRLATLLGITQSVRVLESAIVRVPAVIGWLRPVILLPASALTGLTPQQLDALITHELAHVRRYDYLVNLVQSVIETLLFYHPAVWWVSKRVREEREHCCDDLAVAVCGDPHAYATALVGMEGLRAPSPAFAVAASGGSLLNRIRRLVAPSSAEIFPGWVAGLAAGMLALTIGGGAGLLGATATIQESGPQPGSRVASGAAPRSQQSFTDSVVAYIRSFRDADARKDVVEKIGQQRDWRAWAALFEIARTDEDEDVQSEAVASLGEMKGSSGLDTLASLLEAIALNGSDTDVQREAVEALSDLHDARALERVRHLAQVHPSPAVRREAIDNYAEATVPEDALQFLTKILATDGSLEVQAEALEELADLRDGIGMPAVIDAARSHPSPAVRAEARHEMDDSRDVRVTKPRRNSN